MYPEFLGSNEKYLANLRSGRRDYARGNVQSFAGFSPNIIGTFALRCFYSERDEQLMRDRLVVPIEQLAQETGVNIYPLSLWKPHTSMFILIRIPGITPGSREEIQSKIDKDPRITDISQSLIGEELRFNYLWAGTTITIAASQIPTRILEARRQLTQIAGGMSMSCRDYSNIFHISLARIAGVTDDLPLFGRELMKLHYSIYDDPLVTTVTAARVDNDRQFVETFEAPLMESVRLHKS